MVPTYLKVVVTAIVFVISFAPAFVAARRKKREQIVASYRRSGPDRDR